VPDPDPTIAVVPVTLAHVDALLVGDDMFQEQFGWEVVRGYLDFPEVLPRLRDGLAAGDDPQWGSQLFVDVDANELVGLGGFKGPPNDGTVEIGYSIAPSRRQRGLATAVARVMIERAREAGVPVVRAHTLPEENASTHVLRRCGFAFVDTVLDDPDDGPVWRWELPLA